VFADVEFALHKSRIRNPSAAGMAVHAVLVERLCARNAL
jgi:hypothetical protein